MKRALPLVIAALALSAGGPAMAQDCDLSNIGQAREMSEALSARAIEVIERATSDDWAHDDRLARLVAPSAAFNLGIGDVGGPFAPGVAGAHALATRMHATNYRYLEWNNPNFPADACERRTVVIEFFDPAARQTSQIEFIFEDGKVVSATGWMRTFQTGSLAESRP